MPLRKKKLTETEIQDYINLFKSHIKEIGCSNNYCTITFKSQKLRITGITDFEVLNYKYQDDKYYFNELNEIYKKYYPLEWLNSHAEVGWKNSIHFEPEQEFYIKLPGNIFIFIKIGLKSEDNKFKFAGYYNPDPNYKKLYKYILKSIPKDCYKELIPKNYKNWHSIIRKRLITN